MINTNSKTRIALAAHLAASCQLPLYPSASISVHVFVSLTTYGMCWRVPVCMHVFAVWLYKPRESRELSEGGCPGFLSKNDEHLLHNPRTNGHPAQQQQRKNNHQKKLPNQQNSPPSQNRSALLVLTLINTSVFSFPLMYFHIKADNVTYPSSSDGEQPLWQRIKTYTHSSQLHGDSLFALLPSELPPPAEGFCRSSAASLGFAKWIREAWIATFLAACTRCTLSRAAESLNTCWA